MPEYSDIAGGGVAVETVTTKQNPSLVVWRGGSAVPSQGQEGGKKRQGGQGHYQKT